MNRLISFFSTFLLASVVCAEPVTVPNTFSAGTPAKASEVNANFTALANAVNNYPKPLMVYDGTGKVVGYYSDVSGDSNVLINENGTLVKLRFYREEILKEYVGPNYPLYYTSSDCTGQAYLNPFHFLNAPIRGALSFGSSSMRIVREDDLTKRVNIIVSSSQMNGDSSICNIYPTPPSIDVVSINDLYQFDLPLLAPPFTVH